MNIFKDPDAYIAKVMPLNPLEQSQIRSFRETAREYINFPQIIRTCPNGTPNRVLKLCLNGDYTREILLGGFIRLLSSHQKCSEDNNSYLSLCYSGTNSYETVKLTIFNHATVRYHSQGRFYVNRTCLYFAENGKRGSSQIQSAFSQELHGCHPEKNRITTPQQADAK